MLHRVVFVGGDGLPAVHPRQGGDGEGAGPLRRGLRIAVVVTDAGEVAIGPEPGQIPVQLVGVHGVAPEDAVILDAQRLGGLVQDHDDAEGRQTQAASVHHLEGLFRHFGQGLDHGGVDLVGVGGGDDVIRVYLVAPGGADPVDLPVLHQDLFHVLPILDLHAHFLRPFRHLEAHLVGELPGDIGAVADVVRHEDGEDGEGQVGKAAAHVDPVGGQQVPCLLGQIEGVHDLRRGVACGLHEGLVLQEHHGLAHGVDGQLVHAVENGVTQIQQL